MGERRQAARREAITVVVHTGAEFVAEPLPWMQANDLGNEIVRQNAASVNEFLRVYVNDEGLPQLEMTFRNKISDWATVLQLAFPSYPDQLWDFTSDECADLVIAALEVNHLENLRHLVDPNLNAPMNLGGTGSSEESGLTSLGQKMQSMLGSDSTDSTEKMPSLSLAGSSSPSPSDGSTNSGTKEIGS